MVTRIRYEFLFMLAFLFRDGAPPTPIQLLVERHNLVSLFSFALIVIINHVFNKQLPKFKDDQKMTYDLLT